MVAAESHQSREVSSSLAREAPDRLVRELKKAQTLTLPSHHDVRPEDFDTNRLHKILIKAHECQPQHFEALLGLEGVGAKTIRAISLVAELVYGVQPSYRDPARFSFAHGGKDGHPYPVDRESYDRSIELVQQAIQRAKIGQKAKLDALRRLGRFLVE